MTPLLLQLADLASDNPFLPKTVFVPSAQYGVNLTTALGRHGISTINVEFQSPSQLASIISEPILAARDLRPLDADAAPLIVLSILKEVLARDDGAYFRELGPSIGLARKVAATINAMRLSGIGEDDLQKIASPGPRQRAVIALYRRYCDVLDDHKLTDQAGVLHLAIEAASAKRLMPRVRFFALDALRVGPLEEAFMRVISGEELTIIGDAPLESPPGRMAVAVFKDEPRHKSHQASSPQDIRLATAVGEEAAVRGVVRDVLRSRAAYDDAEIAVTAESPYVATLLSLAETLNIPMTFSQGVPIRFTRPGQALSAMLQWIREGYDAAVLASLLRSGLLTFKRSGIGNVDPIALARFVVTARLPNGRAVYENVPTVANRRAEVPEQTFRQYASALNALATALPGVNESCTFRDLGKRCIDFLRGFVSPFDERDAHVIDSIESRLKEASGSFDDLIPTSDLFEILGSMVRSHRVEARSAQPGAVHVTTVQRAGYTGRKRLYVLGLEESNFPGNLIEDPFLLDEERLELGVLSLESDRPAEQVWHLRRAMASAQTVHLVAVTRGVAGDSEAYPSPFFEGVRSDLGLEEDEIDHWAIVPNEREALSTKEGLLAKRLSRGTRTYARAAYPSLERGRRAEVIRAEPRLTEFDGILDGETPPEPPWTDAVVSPSMLENLAACPHRHFLGRVLQVRVPDEYEASPSVWLDPRDLGSLLHDVLHEFMAEVTSRGESVSESLHADLLRDVMSRHVETWRRDVVPPNQAAFERQRRSLERAADIFLTVEAKSAAEGLRPAYFEHEVGPTPVTIGERTIHVRGRIDRIDESDEGYHIWDYKSGSASRYPDDGLLSKGLNLQWALYAHAFKPADGRPVAESGYYFTSDRELGKRVAGVPPSTDRLSLAITPLLEMVERGLFPKVQKREVCRYCDFAPVCSDERILKKQWEAICENEDDDRTAVINAWMESE